jgi:hypothetical protein
VVDTVLDQIVNIIPLAGEVSDGPTGGVERGDARAMTIRIR